MTGYQRGQAYRVGRQMITHASVDAENIFSFCLMSSGNGTIYDASDPSALVTSGESRTRCALRCFSMNQGRVSVSVTTPRINSAEYTSVNQLIIPERHQAESL